MRAYAVTRCTVDTPQDSCRAMASLPMPRARSFRISFSDQADFDLYAMRSPVIYAEAIKAAIEGNTAPLRALAEAYVIRTTPDAAYLGSKAIGTYIGSDGHRMALVKGQHVRASCRSP